MGLTLWTVLSKLSPKVPHEAQVESWSHWGVTKLKKVLCKPPSLKKKKKEILLKSIRNVPTTKLV